MVSGNDPSLIRELFDRVAAEPRDRWDKLLETERRLGVDPAVINRVRELLGFAGDAAARAPGGVTEPLQVHRAELERLIDEAQTRRIGRYTIIRVLGEGGMGTVYEAEQENPKRLVALKVIRAGYLSPELLRRFVHESQVLGRLQHPGIAQVYEAGTVQDDRGRPLPFFAMEFIKGAPLTDYAAQKKLGTRERLELIARVCDAVYHAHQKGVIHRDLKPGNILVDESGQPKVLDFGVARATDSDIQQTTLGTDIGQLIGTVPYMSPEQAGGSSDDLDTRSDVYALGVIAFELLAGRLPHELKQKMIAEAARIIREEEPTRLSSFDRTLRGDIETIVAKALEKDRSRRYQSAESLASDIRHYLRDEPIAARPASTWYQLSKFSRRNRGLVWGVVGTVMALLGGIIATGVALNGQREQRRQAQLSERKAQLNADRESAARRRSEAILGFVTKSLQSTDPIQGGAQRTTIVEAMENALRGIEQGELHDDPDTQTQLIEAVATILNNNGEVQRADALLRQVLQAYRALHPDDHPDVARALNNAAGTARTLGRLDEAAQLYRQALEMQSRLSPGDDPGVAFALANLAFVLQLQGHLSEAEPLFDRALGIRTRLYPDGNSEVAESLVGLAFVRLRMDRIAEAEPLLQHAIDLCARLHEGDRSIVSEAHNGMAQIRVSQGRFEEAANLFQEVLDMRRQMFSGDHPSVAASMNNLVYALLKLDRAREAEPIEIEALELCRRIYGPDHSEVATCLSNLAEIQKRLGRLDQAVALVRQVIESDRKRYNGDHPDLATSLNNLAMIELEVGNITASESTCTEALEMRRRLFPADHGDTAQSINGMAQIKEAKGNPLEAASLYADALAIRRRILGNEHPLVIRGMESLAKCLASTGRLSDAIDHARAAAELASRVLPEDHPLRNSCSDTLADIQERIDRSGR